MLQEANQYEPELRDSHITGGTTGCILAFHRNTFSTAIFHEHVIHTRYTLPPRPALLITKGTGTLHRPHRSGPKHVTCATIHLNNVEAKKKDATRAILTEAFTYLNQEPKALFVGGDWNNVAYTTHLQEHTTHHPDEHTAEAPHPHIRTTRQWNTP